MYLLFRRYYVGVDQIDYATNGNRAVLTVLSMKEYIDITISQIGKLNIEYRFPTFRPRIDSLVHNSSSYPFFLTITFYFPLLPHQTENDSCLRCATFQEK